MSVPEPGKILTPWATSGLKNAIPATANPITGNAGYDQGFPAINMTPKEAGGIPPFGQDFNGILYEITNTLRYIQAGGTPTYSATLSTAIGGYPKGAILLGDDGVTTFRSLVDSNTNNPNSVLTNWAKNDSDRFAASLYANGYQKLPSGLIIQWGLASLAYSGLQEYTGTVTMPITFPSAMRSIVGTSNDAMNTAKIVMELTGPSSSAWKARFEGDMSGGGNTFTWIAIGC